MSAGRYMAYDTYWSHEKGPEGAVADDIAKGELPAGTKVVSWAENGSVNPERRRQVIGLQFTSARAAAGWVVEQELIWGEDGDHFHRFTTKRDLEAYLDDTSMATYLGL